MRFAEPSRKLSLAIAGTLAASQPPAALAAAALEEIIVTARKREENLQEIPESIQALPAAEISRAGLQELEDYSRFIPSLSYTAQAPGANKLIFRGVADTARSFYSDTSAAIYLDEQPLTQPTQTPEPRLVDIERIEALSGPQGTLYGGSAQSGTLRIVTNKPDPTQFEAIADATLKEGSTSDLSHDVSGVLNLPLIPTASRSAWWASRRRTLGSSTTCLVRPRVEPSTTPTSTGKRRWRRHLLRRPGNDAWVPNDDWTVTAGVVFQNFEGAGNQDHEPDTAGPLKHVRFVDEEREDEWAQIGLTLEADLVFADLVSATTYFTRDVFYNLDNTVYASYLRTIYATMPTTRNMRSVRTRSASAGARPRTPSVTARSSASLTRVRNGHGSRASSTSTSTINGTSGPGSRISSPRGPFSISMCHSAHSRAHRTTPSGGATITPRPISSPLSAS